MNGVVSIKVQAQEERYWPGLLFWKKNKYSNLQGIITAAHLHHHLFLHSRTLQGLLVLLKHPVIYPHIAFRDPAIYMILKQKENLIPADLLPLCDRFNGVT